MAPKRDLERHIVTKGNYAMVARDQAVFSCPNCKYGKGGKLFWAGVPGQLIAFTIDATTLLPVTVDNTDLAGLTADLYVGVLVDTDGDGAADDVRLLAGEELDQCRLDEVKVSAPVCGGPHIEAAYLDCVKCDEHYTARLTIDDNRVRSFGKFNKSYEEIVASIPAECHGCTDCPPDANCEEIMCKLVDALNFEIDLKVNDEIYPDWRGSFLPKPYRVVRLHDNWDVFCLNPITVDIPAVAATSTLTLTGQPLNTETVTIGATTYTFLTVFVDAADNVLIGADEEESLRNLTSAVNGAAEAGAVEGTDFATGQTANASASAAQGAGFTMDLTALVAGQAGNTIETTDTLTNGSFPALTMTGGDDAHDTTTCEDCTGVPAITQMTITVDESPVVVNFTGNLDPADNTHTLLAQLENIAQQIECAFEDNHGKHTGFAFVSRGATDCCPIQLHVVHCDDTFTLSDGTDDLVACDTILPYADFTTESECADCGVDGTTTYTPVCGIAVIVEQERANCGCYVDKPLAWYGRSAKLEFIKSPDNYAPIVKSRTLLQGVIPENFGAEVQWEEYEQMPGGRGRQYRDVNAQQYWLGRPDNLSRAANAVTHSDCDKSYCRYFLRHHKHVDSKESGYNILKLQSNIWIPSDDTTTQASWETFFGALIAAQDGPCNVLGGYECYPQPD